MPVIMSGVEPARDLWINSVGRLPFRVLSIDKYAFPTPVIAFVTAEARRRAPGDAPGGGTALRDRDSAHESPAPYYDPLPLDQLNFRVAAVSGPGASAGLRINAVHSVAVKT